MERIIKIKSMFFLVAFLLTGFSQSLFAQDVRELWKDGNEKYTQGQFAEALGNYTKIEEAGYTSEALLYNIGNTYFKLKENG
ncbi:MAG: hypothetical protein HGA83_06745, partial [Bacteroidales bacterium]|nr:hypothetical protein [Bacteroidales bacterium]